MKVLVNLGETNSGWTRKARLLAAALRPILESLVTVDQLFLANHHVPRIYESGVRYKEEPSRHALLSFQGSGKQRVEEFAAIPAILQRGWGDCDDLAPWRCAELRMQGEKAKLRVQWRRQANGSKLYHIVVRRADGSIEDPSRLLGMGR